MDGLWATKSEGLIVHAISFQDFNRCGPDPPTLYRRTDRQTDRHSDDMQSQYCALHYSASRGKNYNVAVHNKKCNLQEISFLTG